LLGHRKEDPEGVQNNAHRSICFELRSACKVPGIKFLAQNSIGITQLNPNQIIRTQKKNTIKIVLALAFLFALSGIEARDLKKSKGASKGGSKSSRGAKAESGCGGAFDYLDNMPRPRSCGRFISPGR